MMKHPTEDDFTVVEVFESGVSVLFEPTQSFYTFYRLADPNDIKRFGPVSPEPDNIRHACPLATSVTTDQMRFKGWHIRSPQMQRRRSSQRAGCALRAELRFFARWV
ncbi:MAG: hypothetical protein WA820_16535 [Bradyrhizobium sp.]